MGWHHFITQFGKGASPQLSMFQDQALKSVFREQAAHNIIDPLRDYHLRFQGMAPEQYDARQIELLNMTEADGLLLMKSCLDAKSGSPSKHWRTGGKRPIKNDIASLNTTLT
jgi:hypothetical protein